MSRLPSLVRQTKVFDLVVAGKSYQEICKKLKISEDTVARDMAEVAEQVQSLVRERHGEILAVALAHYTAVVDAAWQEYHADVKLEKQWWKGELDYPVAERTEKTLETKALVQPMTESDEDEDDIDLGMLGDSLRGMDDPFSKREPHGDAGGEVSPPLEVRTKISTVRPAYKSARAQWLKLIVEATREITELAQLKRLVVEHGGAVANVHMTLDEWKAEAQRRRADAEATLNLLDESVDA